MSSRKPAWASNPRILTELQTQAFRIRAAVSAAQLWEQVLTQKERRRLGGDLQAAWRNLGTAGMWMKLRRVPLELAVLETGLKLGFLDPTKYQWLLREIGRKPALATAPDCLEWISPSG